MLITALAALSSGLLVADSWMTLVAGREIAEHGIPDRETLTVIAAGERWVDQQWLAQIAYYGIERLLGLGGVAIVNVLLIAGTYASGMAAARLLGASARAAFVVATPALFVAPWSWQIRAQAFALPLFVWTLWLAADHVRRPSRRILLAVPLLVVWANLHGSVILGAAIVSLAVVVAAVRRARSARELAAAAAIGVAAPLSVFATPYGLEMVDYYHRLIVDPPFGDAIVEWQRTTPSGLTAPFFGLLALAVAVVVWKRGRLTLFEHLVLLVLAASALEAVRGIIWFSLGVVVLVPNALDGVFRRPDVVRLRKPNLAVAGALSAAALVTLGVVASRPSSWFERTWPDEVLTAVSSAGPSARVYPSDRHADWLLWRLPELRGRVAYDVRFELLSKEQFRELAYFDAEYGRDWKRAADGYRVVVVDESSGKSHTRDLLAEPGARVAYRDPLKVTVIMRRPATTG